MCYSRKRIVLVFLLLLLVLPVVLFSQEQPQAKRTSSYSFDRGSRDPFSPLVSKSGLILISRETDVTNMVLGGIIYSESNAVAIINNEVVAVGDMIGKYKVLVIDEKKVVLEKDNQGFTLNLEE